MEALARPGDKEGAVKMIKAEDNSVQAYSVRSFVCLAYEQRNSLKASQWSSASRTWQQIGEVVDGVGSGRKQLYMGQEYDYVFDVDFKEGSPTLKLPYNITQNPYEAAQKFLFAHEMPQEYMDQVVQFIEKNTRGVALGTGSNDFVDPYTGASRYTGGGAGSAPVGSSTGLFSGDPYTGESLPFPSLARSEKLADLSSGTGGGRTAPAASKTPSLLPHVHTGPLRVSRTPLRCFSTAIMSFLYASEPGSTSREAGSAQRAAGRRSCAYSTLLTYLADLWLHRQLPPSP